MTFWRFGAESARTEGGEALTSAGMPRGGSGFDAVGRAVPPANVMEPMGAPWHVLWTHSNCEDLVGGQLRPAGCHPFLPGGESGARRHGRRSAGRGPRSL